MGEASYGVKLQDGLSGPAHNVVAALKEMKQGAAGAAAEMQDFARAMTKAEGSVAKQAKTMTVSGKAFVSDYMKQAAKATKSGSSWTLPAPKILPAKPADVLPATPAKGGGGLIADVGKELVGSMTKASLLADGIKSVASSIWGAVKAAMALAFEFAKSVVSSALMGQKVTKSFEMVTGSVSGAKDEMAWARKTATELGLDLNDTYVAYKNMLGMGKGQGFARDMVLMAADMGAMGASTEEINSALRQMTQMLGKGKASAEELNIIFESLPTLRGGMIANLAKDLKKSQSQISEMLGQGKITAEQALKAMQAAVLEATGGKNLGDAARKNASTVEGTWNRLKTMAQGALMDIGAKVLPVLEARVVPIFEKLMAYMSSPEGSAMIDGIAKSFADLATEGAKFLADLTKSGNLKDLGTGIKDFVGTLSSVVGALGTIGTAISWIGKALYVATYPLIGVWVDLYGMIKTAVTAISDLFTSTGVEAANTKQALYNWIGEIGYSISSFFSSIGSWISDAAGSLYAAGANIMNGLWDGIKSMFGAIIDSVTGLANDIANAVSSALEIESPSKVMKRLGVHTGKGFQLGVESTGAGIQSTMQAVAAPPGLGGSVANMGARTTTQKISVPITVQGSDDPAATAAAVEQRLMSRLGDAFDKLALQYAFA